MLASIHTYIYKKYIKSKNVQFFQSFTSKPTCENVIWLFWLHIEIAGQSLKESETHVFNCMSEVMQSHGRYKLQLGGVIAASVNKQKRDLM